MVATIYCYRATHASKCVYIYKSYICIHAKFGAMSLASHRHVTHVASIVNTCHCHVLAFSMWQKYLKLCLVSCDYILLQFHRPLIVRSVGTYLQLMTRLSLTKVEIPSRITKMDIHPLAIVPKVHLIMMKAIIVKKKLIRMSKQQLLPNQCC